MGNPKKAIAAFLPDELANHLGLKSTYRGTQVFKWVQSHQSDFSSMSDLSLPLRSRLAESFVVLSSEIMGERVDPDGTVKYRIALRDGSRVECVLLTDANGRRTACLSTQVGCGMGCLFCSTGKMGLTRNLYAHEIVEQLLLIMKNGNLISNIVFMGMGEPLSNVVNLQQAIRVIRHPAGLGLSSRKITVSTCGIVAGIHELAKAGPYVRLSFSLVSALPGARERLMPSAKSNSLVNIQEALIRYKEMARQRISLQIVLFKGLNNKKEDIEAIARFSKPLSAVVNLIPWNASCALPFSAPTPAAVRTFRKGLVAKGIPVTQRFRRGTKIDAACGQLFALEDSPDPPDSSG